MNEKDARKIILDAFRRLAMSHGLKRITIDMLAAECGISKKTIYKYYDSKEEIIEKFANDIVDKVKKEFYKIQLIEENPEQAMVKFFGIIWEIIRNIPATIIQDARMYYPKIERMIEDLKNEYNAVFVDNIKKGIAAGVFRDINPAVIEAVYLAAANSVFAPQFILEHNLTVQETFLSFQTILMNGILNK